MFKVGDRVKVIADYSCFFCWCGTIVEDQNGVFAIQFVNMDRELFFQPEELEKIND